jgi:hypothetical protein
VLLQVVLLFGLENEAVKLEANRQFRTISNEFAISGSYSLKLSEETFSVAGRDTFKLKVIALILEMHLQLIRCN